MDVFAGRPSRSVLVPSIGSDGSREPVAATGRSDVDANTIEQLLHFVMAAMFIGVGVLTGYCGLLIFRSQAYRPIPRHRAAKSADEEEADRVRRERIRSWFSGRR